MECMSVTAAAAHHGRPNVYQHFPAMSLPDLFVRSTACHAQLTGAVSNRFLLLLTHCTSPQRKPVKPCLSQKEDQSKEQLVLKSQTSRPSFFGSISEENLPDDQIQGGVIALDFLIGCTGVHGAVPAVEVGVAGVTPQLQPCYYRHVGGKPLHC